MKKNIIIVSILLIIVICTLVFSINNKTNTLKKAYESLNNKYITVSIPSDTPITYSNYEEIFEVLKHTGIIYFCSEKYQSCRDDIKVLQKAADETGVEKIYYLDISKDRDIKNKKDGKIITQKESTNNYKKLLKKLKNNVKAYKGLNDESAKRIYMPTFISVKSGKITSYISVNDNENNKTYKKMNKEEITELREKYINAINETLMCNNVKEEC